MPQQGFNVEDARKSGYSDDEILSHLTTSRKFDIDSAVKSGYSKSDIIQHLSSTPAPRTAAYGQQNENKGAREVTAPKPMTPEPSLIPPALKNVARGAYNATIGMVSPIGPNGIQVPPLVSGFSPIGPATPGSLGSPEDRLRVPPAVDAFLPFAPSDANNRGEILRSLRPPPIVEPIVNVLHGGAALAGLMPPPTDAQNAAAQEGAGGILGGLVAGKAIEAAPKVATAIRESAPVVSRLGEPIAPATRAAHTQIESVGKIWPDALKIEAGLTDKTGGLLAGEQPTAFAGSGPTQILRQAARNLGLDPNELATGGGIEQVNLGVRKSVHDQMRTSGGKQAMGPIVKELADEAVRISDQPIRQAVTNFAKERIQPTQTRIVERLRAAAKQERFDRNFGKADSLDAYADSVERADGTVSSVDRVKIGANEKIADAKKNPSAQSRADQSPMAAHEDAAAIIRQELYPALERMAGIDDGALVRAGVEEHRTMKLRDAMYENYDRLVAAGRPNPLQKVAEGVKAAVYPKTEALKFATKSSANAPQTMGEFNATIRAALKNLGKDAPLQQPVIMPMRVSPEAPAAPNVYGVNPNAKAPIVSSESSLIDPVTGRPIVTRSPEGYGRPTPPPRGAKF